jgi:hypothetical protein
MQKAARNNRAAFCIVPGSNAEHGFGRRQSPHLCQRLPAKRQCGECLMPITTIVIIVLILVLIGAIPAWPHSRSWGYGPSGILGVVLVVVLVLLLMGRI